MYSLRFFRIINSSPPMILFQELIRNFSAMETLQSAKFDNGESPEVTLSVEKSRNQVEGKTLAFENFSPEFMHYQ